MAAAIMAFTLTGLLALFLSCMLLNEANRNLTLAAGHAQFVLEEIKNTDFSLVLSKINNNDWNWNETDIGSKGLTALTQESIVTTKVGSATDPLDVLVTLSWQDRIGHAKSLELETIFTGQ